MQKFNKEKFIQFFWIVVMFVLFAFSMVLVKNGYLIDTISMFGGFAFLVVFLLKITTLVIAPLGGTPLYILSGVLFGGLNGFLICFAGDAVGSIICFLIARRYGARVVESFVGKGLFDKVLKSVNLLSNTKSFLKARLAFFGIPEVLAYASGLSRMPLSLFAMLHLPFYVVTDLLLVFLGAQITSFISDNIFLVVGAYLVFMIGCIFFLRNDYEDAIVSGE